MQKEVLEETGFKVDVLRLLGIHDHLLHNNPRSAFQAYKLFFACGIVRGAFMRNAETDAAEFFDLEGLRSSPRPERLQNRFAYSPGWLQRPSPLPSAIEAYALLTRRAATKVAQQQSSDQRRAEGCAVARTCRSGRSGSSLAMTTSADRAGEQDAS